MDITELSPQELTRLIRHALDCHEEKNRLGARRCLIEKKQLEENIRSKQKASKSSDEQTDTSTSDIEAQRAKLEEDCQAWIEDYKQNIKPLLADEYFYNEPCLYFMHDQLFTKKCSTWAELVDQWDNKCKLEKPRY